MTTYVGVRLHNSMTWSYHIQLKINKVTKFLTLSSVCYKCTKEVKKSAYFSLVRPVIEYVAVIWDSHQKYLIDNVEKIQRGAARWVMEDYRLTSDSDMILALNWSTLEQRCYDSRLTMFYNLVKTNSSINVPLHYSPHTSAYNTCQLHPLHFAVPWLSTTYYQMSFFPKTIRDWNKLPPPNY